MTSLLDYLIEIGTSVEPHPLAEKVKLPSLFLTVTVKLRLSAPLTVCELGVTWI
jgi:hypothetical protein